MGKSVLCLGMINEGTNQTRLDARTREMLRAKVGRAINNAKTVEAKAVRTLKSWDEAREGINRALNVWND